MTHWNWNIRKKKSTFWGPKLTLIETFHPANYMILIFTFLPTLQTNYFSQVIWAIEFGHPVFKGVFIIPVLPESDYRNPTEYQLSKLNLVWHFENGILNSVNNSVFQPAQ